MIMDRIWNKLSLKIRNLMGAQINSLNLFSLKMDYFRLNLDIMKNK